jgi:sulfur-oxidizing protein SoxX
MFTKTSKILTTTAVGVLAVLLSNVAVADTKLEKKVQEVVASSFKENGIAKLDRLQQDFSNKECSKAEMSGKPINAKVAKKIEAMNLATIKLPSDGNYIGSWKEGEKLAQNGRGNTWSDKADAPNGGNCYNCHKISNEELSYGTIGPSLYNYGKLRGVTDVKSESAKATIQYTWGKMYNSQAYNACSSMPRFGHVGALTEAQMRDLMALLLDPQSPVNK